MNKIYTEQNKLTINLGIENEIKTISSKYWYGNPQIELFEGNIALKEYIYKIKKLIIQNCLVWIATKSYIW